MDWYHASDFTDELSHFLGTKVKLLIENNCLQQAFELTNVVFDCIGNIDMDDSDGSSAHVANSCYDCWKQIIEKADDALKTEIKKWFEEQRDGYENPIIKRIDYMKKMQYFEEQIAEYKQANRRF